MTTQFKFAADAEKPAADRRGPLTGIGRAATLSVAQAFAAGLGNGWTLERIYADCRKLEEAGR